MGFRQAGLATFDPQARRRAVAIAFVALVLIVIPLALTSHRLIITNKISARTYALGQEWLDGSGYRLMSVDAETADGTVNLLLLGDGELPPLDKLENSARDILFGRTLRLKVVESQTLDVGP
jgi:hypothetical protein